MFSYDGSRRTFAAFSHPSHQVSSPFLARDRRIQLQTVDLDFVLIRRADKQLPGEILMSNVANTANQHGAPRPNADRSGVKMKGPKGKDLHSFGQWLTVIPGLNGLMQNYVMSQCGFVAVCRSCGESFDRRPICSGMPVRAFPSSTRSPRFA